MKDSFEFLAEGYADLLEECDLCHDFFDFLQIKLDFNGHSFYCDKCRS